MQLAQDLEQIRDRLSNRLLDLDEVNGVSIEKGHVIVYIVHDSRPTRDAIEAIIAAEAPQTPIDYVTVRRFRAL